MLNHKIPFSALVIGSFTMWLLVYLFSSAIASYVATTVSGIGLIMWFWQKLGNKAESLNLLHLGGAYLLLTQNLSWLVASYVHIFKLNIPIQKTLSNAMADGVTIQHYTLAILFITLFCWTLYGLGNIQISKILHKRLLYHIEQIRQIQASPIVFFMLLLIGLQIFLVAKGIIGNRTIIVEGYNLGKIPMWVVLFQSLIPLQPFLVAVLIYHLRNRTLKYPVLSFTSTMLLLLPYLFIRFSEGRYPFFTGLLSILFWYSYFNGKPKSYRLVILVFILYPVISQLLLFNNFMRSAKSGLQNYKGSSIEVIPKAWERFTQTQHNLEYEMERTTENIAVRPLVALPLAACIKLQPHEKTFTLGENIVNSFIWVIPSNIFPNKTNYPVQETLLYQNFRIGKADTAVSLYLNAYTEFNLFGILLYPVLIAALWLFILWLIYWINPNKIILVLALTIFFDLMLFKLGESSLIAWFAALRSVLFWLIIALVLKGIKSIKYART
jgi:hypothetical protein